jgi:predicted RecB family nuclease
MVDTDPGPLTDRLLRSWLRCRRRAWLDRHGPWRQRLWSAHRGLALEEQMRCFVALVPRRPGRGETAAAHGAEAIVGLRLRGRNDAGRRLEAQPNLLQRVDGSSAWGGHAYRPVLARQGRNTTREHRLLLALWGRLLAQRQREAVPHGLVLAMGERGLEQERLALGPSLQAQLDGALEKLAQELAVPSPPPLLNDRRKCALCGWRGLCDAEAQAEGHLSEVSGIGGKRRDLLIDLGITSLQELARSEPDILAERLALHGEQHRDVAPQLVAQARVQAAGLPRRLTTSPALPELEQASGALIYDIESDPDARDDFLHGMLRLDHAGLDPWPQPRDRDYQPLLALREHGEARLWQRLRSLLARYPDWPVLHYGETESLGLLRLAERQGASGAERAALRSRLIDVHQRLRRHWLLPVNSYGLKTVAAWLDFHWKQPGVDGARCLLWWRQWRQERQRRDRRAVSALRLARIFDYNRDDCRATWAVAQWLLEQDRLILEGSASAPGAL